MCGSRARPLLPPVRAPDAPALRRLDVDNTGYITRENMKQVLGDDYDPARVDAMIAEADVLVRGASGRRGPSPDAERRTPDLFPWLPVPQGDNRVSYEEFLRLFRDDQGHMREELSHAARDAGVPTADEKLKHDIIEDPDIPDPTTAATPRDVQADAMAE